MPSRPQSQKCVAYGLARIIAATMLAAASDGTAYAHENRVLTTVAQIRALSATEAATKLSIDLEGVITYTAPEYGVTFFQDVTGGIFVWLQQPDSHLDVGSRVRVNGNTTPGDFAPSIEHAQVRLLGSSSSLPAATPKTSAELLTGKEDSQWVEVKGIVHSVGIEDRLPPDMRRGPPQLVLGMAAGNEKFKARIRDYKPNIDYSSLVDSVVTVRGACGTLFNERRQLVGVQLFVPTVAQIKVEEAAPPDPYSLPALRINSLMQFSAATTSGRRMRINGVVTFQEPGERVYIQDASGGVVVQTAHDAAVRLGDSVDAVGFPSVGRYAPVLEDGSFRVVGRGHVPPAIELSAAAGLSGEHDAELVRIRGQLLEQSDRGQYHQLTMQLASLTFTARLKKRAVTDRVLSLRNGSHLQITGVWSVETDEYRRPMLYQLLLNGPDDVLVLDEPTWWTGERILSLLGVMVGIIVLGALWVAILHRRVNERTETIRATLESTAEGIVVVTSHGRISSFNRKFAAMWNLEAELSNGEDAEAIFSAIRGQLRNPGSLFDLLNTGQNKNGADRPAREEVEQLLQAADGRMFETHSEPQIVKDKEIGRVWGFRDVTERRRAQERLAARTAELDAANQEIGRLNEQLQAENSRMSAELDITRRLQQMMLPRVEELQLIPGLEICGLMQPASEVGGDYYDVIAHDGRVVIGIGDVTGHGLESGVLSIMLQTAVRTLLMSGESDNHRIFETLNRVMYDSARRMQCDRNLTLTLLTFDGSVATISGQHEEIIVLRRNGLLERYDTLDLGFPLGIEPTISGLIAEQQIRLDAGDVVVLYTDGITEAINAAGVAFGLERLAQTVRESNHKSSALIRDAVLSRVRSHIGGCKLLDDMTVVVFKPYVHNVADIRNDKGNLGANRLTQADVSQQTDALHA